MWEKVERYINKNQMFHEGDTVIIGLSGGADSVCLAEFLLYMRDRLHLKLHAVHVNHMLRGKEADQDEAFVTKYCRNKDIILHVYRKDIFSMAKERQISVEEAGRIFRYEMFEKTADGFGGNAAGAKIAVAHHKNDQAETMLFRMARGTGPAGLQGMQPVSGKIVRPLLCIDRREIETILGKLSAGFVTDSTNLSDEHDRNIIRHHILPKLCEINGESVSHLASLAVKMQELYSYLEPKMEELTAQVTVSKDMEITILQSEYGSLSEFEQNEVVRRCIYRISKNRKDISSDHVELVRQLMEKDCEKKLDLPYGLIAVRKIEGIRILNKNLWEKEQAEAVPDHYDWSYEIILPDVNETYQLQLPDFMEYESMSLTLISFDDVKSVDFREESLKNDCIRYFDYDKIKNRLFVRTRQSGDYLVIDHNGNHKSLKRYFIDRKVPVGRRKRLPLLCDGPHVLWVPGERASMDTMISDETKHVLKVLIE